MRKIFSASYKGRVCALCLKGRLSVSSRRAECSPRSCLTNSKERKPEIRALLLQAGAQPMVSYVAGLCPHCKQKLEVYTYQFNDEVRIQCPIKPELCKALKQQPNPWCLDCKERF